MEIQKREPWLLGFALLLPTAVTLAYFWLASSAPPGVQQAVYAIGKGVQFALPVALVIGVLRAWPGWRAGKASHFWQGAAFGLAVMLLTLGLYWLLRDAPLMTAAVAEVSLKTQQLGVDSPAKFAALGLFYAVGHAFLEEYYWRWFVFGRLRKSLANTPSIVISASGFMLHHVVLLATFFPHAPLMVAVLSLAVLVGGLFWAWLYERSGSLLGPWVGHLLVDAGIFAVGYAMLFV